MLDIIREKAGAWTVKIIFGIIIIVFVFFFGYNRIAQRMQGARGGTVVARVNGVAITRPEYQFAYENTLKMYQNVFKGKDENEPLPEGVLNSVKSTALNQLIQQTLIKHLGEKIGLTPTPVEIADAIRNSPVAKGEDGQFDQLMYKQRFLPYFTQKFNINFEDMVAGDLMVQNVQSVFTSGGKGPNGRALYDMEKTKWTFEVTDGKEKPRKVGPINLAGRGQIFATEADPKIYTDVFGMKAGETKQIKMGDKEYKVSLIKIEKPSDADWTKEGTDYTNSLNIKAEQEMFQAFMGAMQKDAKIKRYID